MNDEVNTFCSFSYSPLQQKCNFKNNFKRYRPTRINTSASNNDDWTDTNISRVCKPLILKQYSNKFLRQTTPQPFTHKVKYSCSRRIIRHRAEDKQNNNRTDPIYSVQQQQSTTQNHPIKISTSRALQLFSRILKSNKTEGCSVEYHRKHVAKNSNFNIQRIHLKHKNRLKQLLKGSEKTPAKTQQLMSRTAKQLKSSIKYQNLQIDPWQIQLYADNDML